MIGVRPTRTILAACAAGVGVDTGLTLHDLLLCRKRVLKPPQGGAASLTSDMATTLAACRTPPQCTMGVYPRCVACGSLAVAWVCPLGYDLQRHSSCRHRSGSVGS